MKRVAQTATSQTETAVEYTVIPQNPSAHIFLVQLRIPSPNIHGQVLSLPTWIPGSYMIREFSKNIVQMKAYSKEGALAVIQQEKALWKVEAYQGAITVEYEVYAWDMSVRMAHLDQNHGYFNGTSMFLQVHGQEEETQDVYIEAPTDERCQGWRVSTGLAKVSGGRHDFGHFSAKSYDELIDCPVEMGTFELLDFEARGIKHEIALTGQFRFDREKLIRDLKTICEIELDFLGCPDDMKEFVFQIMVVGAGYGGLEHRSSTSLICSRDSLPKDASDRSDGYLGFLGLCSHEYFHLWNVKRLKPKAYLPYDLSKEAYTTLLWVFEGWTSYYDDMFLVRTGLLNHKEYLNILGKNLSLVRRGSGLQKQSLADSSNTTWTKFYRQDENASNAVVSYYKKGAFAAMLLDLHLRLQTHSKVTLDTVMKELWARFGAKGIGLEEDSVELLTEELSGLDLKVFFNDVVRGTGELPLTEMLEKFGVKLSRRKPETSKDFGGKKGTGKSLPSLDIIVASASDGVKVKVVHDGGAAQKAGLSAGDTIIALDGIKLTAKNIEKRLERYQVAEEVHLHVFRRDELFERKVVLGEDRDFAHYFELIDDCSDDVKKRRESWLKGV